MGVARCAGLALLLTLPAGAGAGPWARGEDNHFLSLGYEATQDRGTVAAGIDPDQRLSLYYEQGLTARLTFGLDAGVEPDGADPSGFAFLRRTLTPGDATHQLALSLGAGAENGGGLAVLGGSWGRGIETRLGGGWATVDGQIRLRGGAGTLAKLDTTLGVRPDDDTFWIGQLQMSATEGADTTARLQASYVRKLNDRLRAELGLLYGLHNDDSAGVTIGTWLEF